MPDRAVAAGPAAPLRVIPRPAGPSPGRCVVLAAEELALERDCVVSRAELATLGVDKQDVRREVGRGRWAALGQHTVAIHRGPLTEPGLWRLGLYEIGSGAALDGVTSLTAAGLEGYRDSTYVSVRHGWQPNRIPGVVVKELRGWRADDVVGEHLPRVRSPLAAVRGAAWARTHRQAALILVMAVQQRIVRADDLKATLARFKRIRRRTVITGVIEDVLDGVHSLGELDFARKCHQRRLPGPTRQVVRRGRNGRVYLDGYFDDFKVIVEIEGAHHDGLLNAIDDALRQNDLSRGDGFVRIPVVGFRTDMDAFMAQVAQRLRDNGWRGPSGAAGRPGG